MISKIVKARKEHKCSRCNGIIRKGNQYRYMSFIMPVYDEDDNQVGIEYITDRCCSNDACDGMLKYVDNPKKYLKECSKGSHQYEEKYEFDHYVGDHRVYVPTGEYVCVTCGVFK